MLGFLFFTPFFIRKSNEIFERRVVKLNLLAGLLLSISIIIHIYAISISSASYVSIITLFMPVFTVLISFKVFRDTLSPGVVIGLSLSFFRRVDSSD